MRIRSIKPEFWTSEDISRLGYFDRLLFIALWSYVDDNGVGVDRVPLIIGDLFPEDMSRDPRDTLARVSEGLEALAEAGLIVRYEADGKRYLCVSTWRKHQRIDKPNIPRYPLPTSGDGDPGDSLATPSRECRESPAPGTEEQRNRGTDKDLCAPGAPGARSAAADAATRESEPKDEPPPLLPVEAETPAPKTKPSSRDLDAAFAKFWDTYPRKKSKAAGRAAYEKAARKVGPQRIQAALEAQLPSLMAKEPDYRPYPATWLNRESWEDEPDAPARSGPLVVSGPRSVDGAIVDDAGTYSGWIHPTPVVRGGVVVHDPLGALGEPVVGGDHDWWAEQGPLSASESPAGSKRGEVPIRAVRAS